MTSSTSSSTALVPYYPEHQALHKAQEYLLKESDFSKRVTIPLPADPDDLYEKVLFQFQRHIEKQYQELPWPEHMKKILVETQIHGGKGDIVAAAKAISLMQRICPETVTFDWVSEAVLSEYDPLSFLTPAEASKVHHRSFSSSPVETDPADFLLIGPVASLGKDYIENRVTYRKIKGPIYGFKEIASGGPFFLNYKLYQAIFPSDSEYVSFPMDILPGTGVFLDPSRMQAPLSRTYCCPSYIHSIQDPDLRKDILESMQVYDDTTTPDYDKYSLNSGYAHRPTSWGKFIDCVAMHEQEKHAVIVLNQKGEFYNLSAEEFCDQIFTPERLDLFKKHGYGSLTLKAQDTEKAFLLSEDCQTKRNLTVIIRPSFKPNDMKQLQLASERLIATGDNTAIESWAARCKLYLYECFPHKAEFLNQQITLAKTIAPSVAKLLEYSVSTSELEEILKDPALAEDTLKFCKYITEHCSFDPIFEAGIKRTAWHHTIPELMTIEEDIINKGKEFQNGLLEYVKDPKPGKSLTISTLPQLKKRVREVVDLYLQKTASPSIEKDKT